jgi:hypothetical protein
MDCRVKPGNDDGLPRPHLRMTKFRVTVMLNFVTD